VGKREDELLDLGRELQPVECLGDASPGNAKVSGNVRFGACLAGVRLLEHAEKPDADTLMLRSRNLIVKCVISLSATSTFPS